jgi:hypothetical protein
MSSGESMSSIATERTLNNSVVNAGFKMAGRGKAGDG